MSTQSIQEKSLVIRNETIEKANSKERIADVIDDINSSKLDKGEYGGTAEDLVNVILWKEQERISEDENLNTAINLAYSQITNKQDKLQNIPTNSNVGVSKLNSEATEKLDVNGNLKADNLKAKSTQFQLQSSINPTPNTLVPKTDGSGLVWYDNNSVPKDLGNSGGSGEKLDKFSKIENITVSQDTNYIYIKGDVLHVIKNGEMGNTTPGSAKITLNGYLEITNGILIEKTNTINNPGHNSGVGGFNFMPYDETIYYKGLYIGFYIRIDKSINPSPFWTNGYGVVCIMLTYADYVGSSKAIGAIRL